jgi:hypothetical protein
MSTASSSAGLAAEFLLRPSRRRRPARCRPRLARGRSALYTGEFAATLFQRLKKTFNIAFIYRLKITTTCVCCSFKVIIDRLLKSCFAFERAIEC